MPPEGYTSLTVPDELLEKLARIIGREDDVDGYREAVEVAVDWYLRPATDDLHKMSEYELADTLASRLGENEQSE